MRIFIRFIPIIFLISLIISQSAYSAETKDVDSINIYDPIAGDFLDVNLEELSKSAFDAYNAADYEKAAKYYLALLKYDIGDSASIYNLACCYGLLGDEKLAAKYLERAVKSGFEDIGHIKQDPDFDKVRGKTEFDNVVNGLESIIAEKEKELGKTVFIDAPALFKCYVHLPENYDPEKKYPLVVGLHGYGSNPERFITLWKRFGNPDFIYATPQAPYPFGTGSELGYSWNTGGPEEEKIGDRSTEMAEEYITRVVMDLHKRYKVSDTYLMGFSQGCGFAYQAGIKHYELFKGLICFGGWLDPEWIGEDVINEAKGLRVFIAHGRNDRMVEFKAGTDARDYLKDHGYDVTFYEFDGAHQVPEDACRAMIEWMKK